MRGSIQTHARTQPQIDIPSHIARNRTGIHSHQLCGLRFITQTSQVNFELDFNGFRKTLLLNVTRLERFLNCPQILFHSFTKSIFFLMNEYCEIQRGKRQNCIHRLLNIDYKPLTFCCIHWTSLKLNQHSIDIQKLKSDVLKRMEILLYSRCRWLFVSRNCTFY